MRHFEGHGLSSSALSPGSEGRERLVRCFQFLDQSYSVMKCHSDAYTSSVRSSQASYISNHVDLVQYQQLKYDSQGQLPPSTVMIATLSLGM
jgi:hypothetical protein